MPDPQQHRTPLVRNNAAALARLFAAMSVVPGLALITGPLAIGFGIAGLRFNRKHPTHHGKRNSWLGIGAGALLFAMTAAFATRVWTLSWREYQAKLEQCQTHPAK